MKLEESTDESLLTFRLDDRFAKWARREAPSASGNEKHGVFRVCRCRHNEYDAHNTIHKRVVNKNEY